MSEHFPPQPRAVMTIGVYRVPVDQFVRPAYEQRDWRPYDHRTLDSNILARPGESHVGLVR